MKIGNFEVVRNKNGRTYHQAIRDHLNSPDGRELLARMARSEVKNYLAELAEVTERPFGSSEAFIRDIHEGLK